MNIVQTALADVLLIQPKIFGDDRGFFYESFNERAFAAHIGPKYRFVQDNDSRSARGVLRGLHYQIQQPQGKLIRCTIGEIYDTAVDIRRSSPTFGKWTASVLSENNKHMLWIPPGFAHGFLVLSEFADVRYKTTDYWAPAHERCIIWSDPDLAIPWPLSGEPILSAKDRTGKALRSAEVFP